MKSECHQEALEWQVGIWDRISQIGKSTEINNRQRASY